MLPSLVALHSAYLDILKPYRRLDGLHELLGETASPHLDICNEVVLLAPFKHVINVQQAAAFVSDRLQHDIKLSAWRCGRQSVDG
jgi:hypothetical protein